MSNLNQKHARDANRISVGTTVKYVRFMMIKVKKSKYITVINVEYVKQVDEKIVIIATCAIYVIKVRMQVDINASKTD